MNFQVLEFQQFEDDVSGSVDCVVFTENTSTFLEIFEVLIRRLYRGNYKYQKFQVVKVVNKQNYYLSQRTNLLDILDWVFSVIKNQGYEIKEYSDEVEMVVVRESIKLPIIDILGK